MPITLLDPAERLDLPPQPLGPSAPAKPTGDPGEFLWNGAGNRSLRSVPDTTW